MAGYMTHSWAIDRCRKFFGLTAADLKLISGTEGREYLQRLWESDPTHFYEHPLPILRQEWFHASVTSQRMRHDGFFEAVTQHGIILDYGCGTAEVSRFPWIVKGHQYIGVEASHQCRAYLSAKYDGYWVQPTETIPNGQVDGLICLDVLEHVSNPIELQAKLWKHLLPGGHALLKFDNSYPHPGHIMESIRQIPDWWEWITERAEIVEVGTYVWVRKVK